MNRICLTLLFFFFVSRSFASFENDSIQLAGIFQSALIQPEKSDSLISSAFTFYQSRKPTLKWKESFYYLNSRYLVQTGQFSEAQKMANEGLDLFDKTAKPRAKFYNLLGSIVALQQDYKKAIAYYKKSLRLLERNNDRLQAAFVKNNIANTFFSLTDYNSAYKYALEAYNESKELKDTVYLPSITAILSVSEVKIYKLADAKKHGEESLKLSEKYKQPLGLIVSNYSIGEYYLAKNQLKKAESFYTSSLIYATQFRQATYIMLVNIGLLTVYNAQKEYEQAVSVGETALNLSQVLKNENTKYSIYKNLAFAYSKIGRESEAYQYMKLSHDMYRKAASTENQKAINELLIQYENEKKEKKLAKQALQLAKRNQLLAWSFVGIVFVLAAIFVLIRRQKIKLKEAEQTKERAVLHALVDGEENERLRISNEIHDGMQSALTGVQLKLEQKQNESLNLGEEINHIRRIQEDARRMAHNLMPLSMKTNGWKDAFIGFCTENSTNKVPIHAFIQTKLELNKSVSGKFVFRILQELVQNALKHANAQSINVNVIENETHLSFLVEDDGLGFQLETTNFGQGLRSIEERLAALSSEMYLETQKNSGTIVRFDILISEFV